MLPIYFKIAWRNLRRQPLFTALNILGLSLGLACFALIGLHVLDELSFDRFHTNNARIFRVLSTRAAGFRGEAAQKEAFLPMPLGPALQAEFGEVETFPGCATGADSRSRQPACTRRIWILPMPIF